MGLAYVTMSAVALLSAAMVMAEPAASAPSAVPANPRLVTLNDFPDGGLSTGPRTVWIYLPQGYAQSQETYRVIYFHDGHEDLFSAFPQADPDQTMRVDVAYDQLIARGVIHPAILVAIDSGPKKDEGRYTELTPTQDARKRGGHIEDYFKFISTQLKPYVDTHYRTRTEPQYTGIAGFSLGGLASFYMGYYHPEIFGMAGCMSSSLWWDEQKLLKTVTADKAPKKPVRFWFDAGLVEGADMWQPGLRAASALVQKGWREGEDVGFFLDYAGEHNHASWAYRAPYMLQFLLGKKQPELAGVAIRYVADPTGGAIRLVSATEDPFATLELQYTGGLRLNAVAPVFTSDNPQVVTIDNAQFNQFENRGRGIATLSASFGGFTASQTVLGYGPGDLPKYSRLACPRTSKPLAIDGSMADWKDMPWFALLDSAAASTQPPARRFAVTHDDGFLYVAVDVTDANVVADAKKAPWDQDGVEVRIDARPDPVRYNAGRGEGGEVLFLAASPTGDQTGVYGADKLPAGVKVICKPTPTGYVFQAAIPASLLDASQKAPWREFRFNVCVNDADKAGGTVEKHWWQPDWRSPQNRRGAGTFTREP